MTDAPEIPRDAHGRLVYDPDGLNLAAFMIDRSPVSIIRGPWGSGSSTACCQRIWQHVSEQRVLADGVRRQRWIIVRDTYPMLETTALQTWLDWFPEKVYGKLFTGSKPYVHEIRVGDIEADVLFYAMEGDGGGANLLSLEPTGIWFNELETISLKLFVDGFGRTGRYPRKVDGGPTWHGVIADLNAVPENHWLPMMMGEAPLPDDLSPDEVLQYERPPDWAYFVQPPGMFEIKQGGDVVGYEVNPEAENLKWLPEGYYEKLVRARPRREINQKVLNKIVPLVEGDPVHSEFNADVHVAKIELDPVPGYPVRVGIDFGRRPAAVFAQEINNRWRILSEVYAKNMGASKFAPKVWKHLQQEYPGYEYIFHGDPKGQDQTQTDERTAYQVFAAHQMPVRPAPVKQNHIQTRLDTVDNVLGQTDNGVPRLVVSKKCRLLKTAMDGGYRWPKERPMVGEDRKPVKDRYSDIADALQYLLLGGGEGRALVGRDRRPGGSRPTSAWKPKSRRRGRAA